jgi:large subunit ribosomal protein L30e
MNEKKFKKILKDASVNKKLKTGAKEVMQLIKGTNVVLTSSSLPSDTLDKIKKLSSEGNIPIYSYNGNSVLLGRLCSLSYPTSVVSLRSVSQDDVDTIMND